MNEFESAMSYNADKRSCFYQCFEMNAMWTDGNVLPNICVHLRPVELIMKQSKSMIHTMMTQLVMTVL